MNNTKYLIGGVVLVLIIVLGLYVAKQEQADEEPVTQAMPVPGNESVEEMVVVENTTAGSYEVYAPEKLAKASDGKVVLFFKASWCPTCKALDGNIKANLDKIPSDVTILEVDYDKYEDLKKKYNVTYQHTMVQVDSSGEMIKKWSGSPTLDSILSNL